MADDLPLPMNDMDTPAPEQIEQPTEQQQADRARDESGRFAPRADEPRGKPDQEAARRREAQERDEARREASEAKTAYATLQKRLDDMTALAKGEDPDAPKDAPEPWKPVLDKVESIEQRFKQQDEQRENEAVWNQVRSFADQDEARFREAQPDFPNAVQHYIQSRVAEMAAFGMSQDQAEQALAQEAQQLLVTSAQANRSPAETLFAMARARGYQPGAATITQPSNVTQMQPRPTGGRSLGTGGGPAGGAMTAAQIAQMDEGDYNAFRATPEGARAIKRAMGG